MALQEQTFYRKHSVQIQSFLIVFLTGLLMHQYVMSNHFFNYFELGNILSDMSYRQGDTLQQGKWFLPVATNLFTDYSIPTVNGVVLIGALSAAVLLLCELFSIRTLLGRVMAGLLFLSFPGMACALSFGVNADVIGLGILLAVLAVYAQEKARGGIWIGALLTGLSIGAYQPSVAAGIAAAYGVLLLETMREDFQTAVLIRKGLQKAAMLLLGFLCYYGVLQAILRITGTSLSSYHGVDQMTSFSLRGIVKGALYAYLYFVRYFFLGEYADHPLRLAGTWIAAVVCLFLLIRQARLLYQSGKRVQTGWLLLLALLLPLGVNAAPFLMADRVGAGVDLYMMFSLMTLWALFWKLLEAFSEKSGQERRARLVSRIGIAACVLVIWNGYILCNQAYHRMEAMTQTTTALLNRMAARIEALPEWESGMPVYFVDPRPLVNENYQVSVPQYDRMKGLVGTELVPWYSEQGIARYLNVYLRLPVSLASEEQKQALERKEDLEQMPSYPAADSMRVIDGVLVVKVSNGKEE